VAYAADVKYGAALELVNAASAAPSAGPVNTASSKARLGSAKRIVKADIKPGSGPVGAIDAVFARLGDGLAVA
jgi:hypothetical protein